MRKSISYIPVVLLMLSSMILSGCAIIFTGDGPTKKIQISANQQQTKITIHDIKNNKNLVINQASTTFIDLHKDGNYIIQAEAPNYKTDTVTLTSHLNGWFLSEAFIGGTLLLLGIATYDPAGGYGNLPSTAAKIAGTLFLIPALFDYLSGNMWELDSRSIDFDLIPVEKEKK